MRRRSLPNANAGRGFVLPLLLGAIAIMATLTAAMTLASRTGLSQVQSAGKIQQLYVQAQLVRTRLFKCGFDYPSGDNGTGYRPQLPAATTAVAVSALVCPGAPTAAGSLWSGTDAVWLPAPPGGFGAWTFVNDATSARIVIQGTSDADLPVINALALRFSPGEAAVDTSARQLTIHLQK